MMDVWWLINSIVCVLFIVAAIWSDIDHNFKGGDGNVSTVFLSILIIVLSLSIILTTPISTLHPYFGYVIGKGGAVLLFIISCFFFRNFTFANFCPSGLSCFQHIVGIIGVCVAIIQLGLNGRGNVQFGPGQKSEVVRTRTVTKKSTKQTKKLPPVQAGPELKKTVTTTTTTTVSKPK